MYCTYLAVNFLKNFHQVSCNVGWASNSLNTIEQRFQSFCQPLLLGLLGLIFRSRVQLLKQTAQTLGYKTTNEMHQAVDGTKMTYFLYL